MRSAASRLELAVSVALGASLVAFTLGSSSVTDLTQLGLKLRWLCLAALLLLSALLLRSRPRPLRVPARAAYAFATGLILLAFESAVWSVRPALTLGRATSLLMLLLVAALLGLASAGRPGFAATLVRGLVGGAAFVMAAGVVIWIVDRGVAVQHASPGTPSRFRGLGQNPNTASLIAAIVLPLAMWQLIEARRTATRVYAGVVVTLLVATIVGSGSYGALGAASAGLVVLASVGSWPRPKRVALVAIAVAAFFGGTGIQSLRTPAVPTAAAPPFTPTVTVGKPGKPGKPGSPGKPGGPGTGGPTTTVPVVTPPTRVTGRLEDEIGSPSNGATLTRRTIFGGSGRALAWQGAIDLGAQRPFLGFGFGTEEHVFVDRWYFFNGSRPENSILGIFLQLGAVGVILIAGLVFAVARSGVRAIRRSREPGGSLEVSLAAAILAGWILALVQSYVYSVGNVGTLPLWVCMFLLVSVSGRPRVAVEA